MNTQEWLNENKLSIDIFNKKYKDGEETLEQFFDRVSAGYEPVRQLIQDKKFLFGGRILASRGVQGRKVTLSNCYVVPKVEDTIESIFDTCYRLAKTYSYGGGVGVTISGLRPDGADVHNASKVSTGPVSFMDLFSQVTQTISQNGRRGALMLSMDINHPDIEKFIDCKTDLSKVNFANISVMVNDKFMDAVEKDGDYWLKFPVYYKGDNPFEKDENTPYGKLLKTEDREGNVVYFKKAKAKYLFTKLARNNWDYAEPGILYWDTISNYNLLNNTGFEYAGVNPCAGLTRRM